MRIKILCAYLSGLGALGWIFFFTFAIFIDGFAGGNTTSFSQNLTALLMYLSIYIPSLSILYLIFSQKLYSLSDLDKIEKQNKLLKMQIEQKKLQQELIDQQNIPT